MKRPLLQALICQAPPPRFLLACVLCFSATVTRAESSVAFFIEHHGKIIEFASDVVSPLDDGLGEIIYTAFEADDLVTPANVDAIGASLRILGWRREGDQLIIHLTRTQTFTVPAATMKYRVVERANVGAPLSACPLPPCEGRRTSPAS